MTVHPRRDHDIGKIKVTLCIATFRRPEGLRELLQSVDKLCFDKTEPKLNIVIVENCPEEPASAILGDIQSRSRWPLTYVLEPVRGIVAARNRGLAEAAEDTDFIAFVDDDETVSPGWLNAMLTTIIATNATAVQGPVIPDYETTPPDWIDDLRIFHLGPFTDGQPLNFAATNNSLVDAHFIRKHDLSFDPRFNDTGGEDEELYNRLRGAGGKICACADGNVTDRVPANRLSLNWIMRRKFRMGNTLARIALLRKKNRMKRFAKGILAIGFGTVSTLLLGFGRRKRFYFGVLEVARGCGMIAAFAKLSFSEYSHTAVLRDRKSSP